MLADLIKSGDAKAIAEYMSKNDLVLDGNSIIPKDDGVKGKMKELATFFGSRQQARKILLNSLYGALLNEALRFSDERMGQSVTLSGRSITKHMNSSINEILTGHYDYAGKAITYADTDSAYFSAISILKECSREEVEELYSALSDITGADITGNAVALYDAIQTGDQDSIRQQVIDFYDLIAEEANSTFPAFMDRTFNTGMERGAIIKAGRELVASRGLFIKKKKYACLIYDDEGTRVDVGDKPGKLKVMGLDLKRADTPDYMQAFLTKILQDVLTGSEETDILEQIANFRTEFKSRPAWHKGAPKKVSNLSSYGAKLRRSKEMEVFTPIGLGDTKKVTIPEHVRASLEWNRLLDQNGDKHSMRITDGSRIVVCKMKSNLITGSAVAYPIDELNLPEWFKQLPFNGELMEQTIIDKKISNLLEVLDWDLKATHHNDADELIQF